MSSAVRSKDRSAAILYRTSTTRRDELQARANAAGYQYVQNWLDALLFGEGRDPQRSEDQEALPMTG